VHGLLPAALAETGVESRVTLAASADEAFRLIAEPHVASHVDERWVAQQVEQIVIHDDDPEVLALPLGHLFGLDDEWEGRWGRTVEELNAEVHN